MLKVNRFFSQWIARADTLNNKTMKNINLKRLIECCEKRARHRQFSWAPAYAEPGYTDPEKGIVFGDWNPVCGFSKMKAEQARDPVAKLARVLEANGFELEWEDEWATCSECGKAVRTSGDCYGWTSYFRLINECELVCLDCLDVVEYLESIEDNPQQACAPEHNPEEHGYVKFNGDFESGWHLHQTDDPKKTLRLMHERGMQRVVFKIASTGQFDVRWQAYYKPGENNETD